MSGRGRKSAAQTAAEEKKKQAEKEAAEKRKKEAAAKKKAAAAAAKKKKEDAAKKKATPSATSVSKEKKKVTKHANTTTKKRFNKESSSNPYAYNSPQRKFARNKASDSPGLKNAMARTVLVVTVHQELLVSFYFAKSNDDYANPYVSIKEKILKEDDSLEHLNIKGNGNRVYPGTNDYIETLASNGSSYPIFQFYRIFESANSVNPVNLKAVATQIALAYQEESDYNTKPQVVLKPPAYDHPINHYLHDTCAARMCSVAYKDAIKSGEFWTDDDLVQTWFGELGSDARELYAVELGLVDELEASTRKPHVHKNPANFENFVHDGDEVEQNDSKDLEESEGSGIEEEDDEE